MSPSDGKLSPTTPPQSQIGASQNKFKFFIGAVSAGTGLLNVVRSKPYAAELHDLRRIYTRLMDHLDDIEWQNWKWCEFFKHVVVLFVSCGLISALVCSLTVPPTNHWRILHLRIWQWVTMAIMIFGVFSIVPFTTFVVSRLIMRFPCRTSHKHVVYFLRKMKRSVDVTIWFCLVLFGWYVWFRPRLKHVNGQVSIIACQQTTRLLIALCIGAVLWSLKNALYYKLKADLHYDQLFDRIQKTVVYLNGYWILERTKEADKLEKLSFLAYGNNSNCCRKGSEEEKVRNIWMDVYKMKRESVPIWILKRLSKEYLNEVKGLKPTNADDLLNDDEELLKVAQQMFNKIRSNKSRGVAPEQIIKQHDEIVYEDLEKYSLTERERDFIMKLKEYEKYDDSQSENNKTADLKDENTQQNTSANGNIQDQQQENGSAQRQRSQNKFLKWAVYQNGCCCTPEVPQDKDKSTPQSTSRNKTIGVDKFLDWAVRLHKHSWGLERTLESSKSAFVKLNRMLSTFLIVLVVIIWLLVSKIVNTSQLALLFAPFLAASFMFENSSKNMFQGIIFTFAMHPFDVGDRVIIEDIQMRVKEVNILTSVFYKYDTGAEVVFPNSKLATTKIVNLDITPDQSDKLEFIIHSENPLENIRDLELKIQKCLDDDLSYASGTKVVKNINPLNKEELQITVHFKYLVSYLTVERKAKHKSDILGKIIKLRKKMEAEENMIEFPLHYKPYTLELTTKTKQAVELFMIERFSSYVLKRLQENHYDYRKIVLINLEDSKIEMDLYVAKAKEGEKDQAVNQSPKPKGKGNQDQSQKPNEEESKVSKLKEEDLMKDEDVLLRDSFFAHVHSVLSEYTNLKVVRDEKPIYPFVDSSPGNAGEGQTLGNLLVASADRE